MFYGASNGAIMAVSVTLKPTFSWLAPKKVFEWPTLAVPGLARTYDVSRDGRRFLMIKEADMGGGAPTAAIAVMLNWGQNLRAKLPN